jgi:hypothetical protein
VEDKFAWTPDSALPIGLPRTIPVIVLCSTIPNLTEAGKRRGDVEADEKLTGGCAAWFDGGFDEQGCKEARLWARLRHGWINPANTQLSVGAAHPCYVTLSRGEV